MTPFVIVVTANCLIGLGVNLKEDAWVAAGINAMVAAWGIFLLVTA